MTFSCTRNVLKKLVGFKAFSSQTENPHLYNWYLDLITVNRKKHLLCTNSKTLFSFLLHCGTKTQVKNLETLFYEKLGEQIIRQIGYKKSILKSIEFNQQHCKFTKTNCRSILGSMNEFKFQIESYVNNLAGKEDAINVVNHYLSQIPMTVNGKMEMPLNLFKSELDKLG